MQDFNRALELKADYVEVFNNRGNVYGAMGAGRLVIAEYTQAINLQKNLCADNGCEQDDILGQMTSQMFHQIPKHKVQLANYLSNRGAAFLAQGDYLLAIQDLKEAAQWNPYLFEAYFNRGLAYKALNEIELAVQDMNKAIKLNPRSTPAYFQRAALYSQFNDRKKALTDLDKVLSYDLNNSEAYYYKSKVLAAEGDYPSALKNLFKARSLGYTINDMEFTTLQEAAQGSK